MKLVFESLNELLSFEKRTNPLGSLGVGQRELIKQWLTDVNITSYKLHDDMSIDVLTPIVNFKSITSFPDYINFNVYQPIKIKIDISNLKTDRDIINAMNLNPWYAFKYSILKKDNRLLDIILKNKNLYKYTIINATLDFNDSRYDQSFYITDVFKKAVDYFIDDINIQDSKGNTLAICAVINKNLDILKFLVEEGIDLNIKNKRNKSVFDYSHASTMITKFLRQFKNSSEYADKEFIVACKGMNYKFVKEMLESDFKNINAINNLGNTVLMTTVNKVFNGSIRGLIELVELLIERGIDINYVNPKNNETALSIILEMYSKMWNSTRDFTTLISVFCLLVKYGADPNIGDGGRFIFEFNKMKAKYL